MELKKRHFAALERAYSDATGSYAVVAFSRDRPMQLYAMLCSLVKAARCGCGVNVLYFPTSAAFASGYETCIQLLSRKEQFRFFRQAGHGSFRGDLLAILSGITEHRAVFLVDDIVFIRSFDLRDFDTFDLRTHVPSLRMGRTVCYSYTAQRKITLPGDLAAAGHLLSWSWNGGDVDWGYPLSVDGHVFLRSEITSIMEAVSFHSPNTLEAALQDYIDFFATRRGICYELPRLVNIPCNRVQSDFDNRHGTTSAGRLLSKWEEGFEIDHDKLWNIDTDSVHMDVPISLSRRPG